jgi:hypothetical protein
MMCDGSWPKLQGLGTTSSTALGTTVGDIPSGVVSCQSRVELAKAWWLQKIPHIYPNRHNNHDAILSRSTTCRCAASETQRHSFVQAGKSKACLERRAPSHNNDDSDACVVYQLFDDNDGLMWRDSLMPPDEAPPPTASTLPPATPSSKLSLRQKLSKPCACSLELSNSLSLWHLCCFYIHCWTQNPNL